MPSLSVHALAESIEPSCFDEEPLQPSLDTRPSNRVSSFNLASFSCLFGAGMPGKNADDQILVRLSLTCFSKDTAQALSSSLICMPIFYVWIDSQ